MPPVLEQRNLDFMHFYKIYVSDIAIYIYMYMYMVYDWHMRGILFEAWGLFGKSVGESWKVFGGKPIQTTLSTV